MESIRKHTMSIEDKCTLLDSQVIEAKREREFTEQGMINKVAEMSAKEQELTGVQKELELEQAARISTDVDLAQVQAEYNEIFPAKESLDHRVAELEKHFSEAKVGLQTYLNQV